MTYRAYYTQFLASHYYPIVKHISQEVTINEPEPVLLLMLLKSILQQCKACHLLI